MLLGLTRAGAVYRLSRQQAVLWVRGVAPSRCERELVPWAVQHTHDLGAGRRDHARGLEARVMGRSRSALHAGRVGVLGVGCMFYCHVLKCCCGSIILHAEVWRPAAKTLCGRARWAKARTCSTASTVRAQVELHRLQSYPAVTLCTVSGTSFDRFGKTGSADSKNRTRAERVSSF